MDRLALLVDVAVRSAFGGTSALAASNGGTASNDRAALIQNEAVIDFGHSGDARVTIKLTLDQAPRSVSTGDFTVRVIIVDQRPNGSTYVLGTNPPTTVR